jgi:HEPN domain-containing protein
MPTLDQQLEWWTKQAANDLEKARVLRQNGFHDGCALMCQQSAEKYLKALFMKVQNQTPPKTHRCDHLASVLGAPADVLDAAREVEADYMESRYPDAASGVPYERFNDTISAKRLQASEEVQRWIQQQLGLTPSSGPGSPIPPSAGS